MQALKTDKNIKLKDDDEECIKFRPSPNFKHMKKYRKSNVEDSNEYFSEELPAEQFDELEKKPVNVMIQPPLPPNPPPPDTLITLKKEIIDDEYENGEAVEQSETTVAEYKMEEPVERSDKKMCRDFARGSCSRPVCRHAHEIILSQLPGVFTFCKNFQNQKGCTLQKCKFVHATVFEKESYFRTGYLPPHALAHLEDNSSVQPPLPPTQEVQQEIPLMYNNPPPAIVQPGPIAPVPVVECPPVPETRTIPDVLSTALALTSPLKREWGIGIGELPQQYKLEVCYGELFILSKTFCEFHRSQDECTVLCGYLSPYFHGNPTDVESQNLNILLHYIVQRTVQFHSDSLVNFCPVNGSPRDLDPNEPLVKKCKLCDVTEFRLQCSKNKLEKLMKTSEEMHKKTAQLVKKNNRLYTVLSLFKTMNAGKANPTNILGASPLNIRNNDNDTSMVDQLSMFFAANNRVTSEEQNHANSNLTLNSNFLSVLMKLLLNSSEQSVSTDSS